MFIYDAKVHKSLIKVNKYFYYLFVFFCFKYRSWLASLMG